MTKKVKSIVEYLKEVFIISKELNNKNPNYSVFYRGESQDYKETRCQPGIFRSIKTIKNEHNLFKEFITLNPDEFYNDKLTIDKLTRMQHYGLPTRLLDLSANALLGLYFAIENQDKDNDAIVYIVSVPDKIIKFYDSDTVSVISNLAKREKFDLSSKYIKNFRDISIKSEKTRYLKKFNNEDDIKYLLHNIKDEKPYFKDEIHPEHINSIVCVKPLQNNKRIIRQQGMFLLFGNDKKNQYKPADLKSNCIQVMKIIIDKHSKEKIKQNLEATGLNKAVVYPDLQTVGEYLKEKYK